MHIIRQNGRDTVRETTVKEDTVVGIFTKWDLTRPDRFRGWKLDILLVPKDLKEDFTESEAYKVVMPCIAQDGVIKYI